MKILPSGSNVKLGEMHLASGVPGWLLDRAISASPNGIVITDPSLSDAPIVYVNPAFLRMTGYSMEEVIGRNCRFLQGEDRDHPEIDELRRAIEQERECRVVLKNYRKDGRAFWNELHVSPVHDEEGRLTNFVGVQNDITERRLVEERFRATFEQAAVGIAHVGPDGRWLRVNGKLRDILGYTEEELAQMNFQEITHSDDLEASLEGVRRMLCEDLGTFSLEKRYVRKGGASVWVNVTVSLVKSDAEEPKYFIVVVEDIGERKKTEEERDLLLIREQRARAEAVAARRRLSLLAAAGPILAASLNYEATLERISRLIVPDLADWCSVDIVDEQSQTHQLAAAHANPDKQVLLDELQKHRDLTESSPGTTAAVLSTGRSILVSEVEDRLLVNNATSGEHLRALRNLEIRSLMSVPLRARGRTLGALTFAASGAERRYDEEDLELAENLAYRCAIAVDNARLYRDRDEISRTLQRSLLPPHLPEVPGVEVGAEYLPVGEANEVGGDFYDIIDTVRGGWICSIGDVRGKGAAAAAVMALARYTIRAISLKDDRPVNLLETLNTAMLHQLPEDRFCTVACVRLEPQDKEPGVGADISCAGHPAPIILRANGGIEEVSCPGKVLGVFEDPELSQLSLRLFSGDTLFLYTDGVTEARSPDGEFFGEDRLRELLRSLQGQDAAAMAASVKGKILAFQNGNPRDDLAVMALRAE